MSSMQKPVLLAVAPNGARKLKTDHPHIPLSSGDIAVTAKDCLVAGASMIHLHVRNAGNTHSLSAELYKQAISKTQKATYGGIFIQVTSEAVGIYSAEQQFEMIHTLKPAAVSIGIREIRHMDEQIISQHFNFMRDAGISPQLILYNRHDLAMYYDWLDSGVIPGIAYPLLLVIGKNVAEGSFDNHILNPEFTEQLRASSWMVCAFGENEYKAGKLAAKLGGHIRVGFENNCILEDGTTANSNAELITQMATYLKSQEYTLARFDQAEDIMRPDW